MIYVVTNEQKLFESDLYKVISVEESLNLLKDCNILQADSETTGRDAHINKILCFQLGSKAKDFQLIIDCTTVNIRVYKSILESKFLIFQNAKFDLQFLYSVGIVPRKIYDTMIVEQFLHLGYSSDPKEASFVSVSLASLAERYLNVYIDKTVRGEIIWRGLDDKVIQYAANDVVYLEDIMWKQIAICKQRNCLIGAKLECDFVPVIAYLEWSGIKLDIDKWKIKMTKDLKNLKEAENALNNFVINNPKLSKFTYINRQGDLFEGFDLTPKCIINWSSSTQVIPLAKMLGFDTNAIDVKSGEDKDSVTAKLLKKQKGINDEFLKLYLGKGEEGDPDYFAGYQGSRKVVTSFGQGHLNAINPITGRIHTVYKQLGADTGRMSSGSTQNNSDLAKLKGLPIKPTAKQKREGLGCSYPNMQQLPHDEYTRACFISEKGNLWVSCDYSAIESRLGGDIYNEKSIIEEFLHGSGDMHSLVAKMVFKELKDVPVKDIKKKFPHLRTKAKPIEFSQQFGGSARAIQNSMGCTLEEAEAFAKAYAEGFPGISKFKANNSKFVKQHGYILLSSITGHKTYWWDFDKWKERSKKFTPEFWEEYRTKHKDTGDSVAQEVKQHFGAASKWCERKALNSPTQGLGAIILKESQINVFNWVVDNGYFGKILLCNLTHDEANWEYPKEVDNFPHILQKYMEQSAAKYCKSLPIPAEPAVDSCWRH